MGHIRDIHEIKKNILSVVSVTKGSLENAYRRKANWCNDCRKVFHRKEILKRHRNSLHPGIKHHCHLCVDEAKENAISGDTFKLYARID